MTGDVEQSIILRMLNAKKRPAPDSLSGESQNAEPPVKKFHSAPLYVPVILSNDLQYRQPITVQNIQPPTRSLLPLRPRTTYERLWARAAPDLSQPLSSPDVTEATRNVEIAVSTRQRPKSYMTQSKKELLKARRNPIFIAIETEDKKQLSTCLTSAMFHDIPQNEAAIYSKVKAFLTTTPTSVFHRLLKTSEADYFVIMMRACAYRHRYELVKNKNINPIIQHLSLNQLRIFINSLHQHRGLAIYRDGRTIPVILDALSARSQESKEASELIYNLKVSLINGALKYHRGVNHKDVVNNLEKLLVIAAESRVPEKANATIQRRLN
jgi:hypothetical protein